MIIGSTLHRLFIERNFKIFNIILTDYENSFSIGLYNINFSSPHKVKAEMTIRLPGKLELSDEETLHISQTLRDGRFFTKIDIIGSVLLYISKCVGINNVYINDNHIESCDTDIALFINPIRFLANYPSIYSNLGFVNNNPELLENVIEKYKKKDIPILDMVNEDQIVSELSIESIAKMYLDKACVYENLCEVLSVVTKEINELIANKYILNLEEIELSYYKNFH